MKKEKSCGCIIINDNKVLVICEKDCDFWMFPKGHVKKGETEIDTSLREVKEEIGMEVQIDKTKRYVINDIIKNKIDKTVVLYLAKPKDNNFTVQKKEIDDAKWCNFDEALEILTFDNRKNIFKKVIEDLK